MSPATARAFAADVDAILARRRDNGGDFWTSRDGRVYIGSPFSTIGALAMLHELGVARTNEAVRGGTEAILAGWRDDGKIRLAPGAPLYPCYTAEAARVLCRFGYAKDRRVQITARALLDGAHERGGWRCSFTKFGRGPETACANPGATLFVLDLLRFTGPTEGNAVVKAAVASLLDHWDSRRPTGPCHYGIGSKFLQVEYPFMRYNLFYYVYVLSFFPDARRDRRFLDAATTLAAKLDAEGRMVVEAPHRGLKGLRFCEKGRPSALATARHREITARAAGPRGAHT